MSTEQNYVGGGFYASPYEQTAGNSLIPSSWLDNRQTVNSTTGELNEAWKPLPGFEDWYSISNTGKVVSLQKERLTNLRHSQKDGAFFVIKRPDKRPFYVNLKRAVATAFLPNPNGYKWVRYKDGASKRNDVYNMEWIPSFLQRAKKANGIIESPTISSLPYVEQRLNRLLTEGKLTEIERKRAEVIPAIEDCMAPLFGASARLVVVPVDRADYDRTTGVVAVVVKAKQFAYYLGRVKSISEDSICVSRDNHQWPERMESRSVIAGLARIVWVIENTVY